MAIYFLNLIFDLNLILFTVWSKIDFFKFLFALVFFFFFFICRSIRLGKELPVTYN